MKITYQESMTKTVDLPIDTVRDVTINYLRMLIAPGEYLREEKVDGKKVTVLKQDDPDHRHGSISEVFVRVATELDIQSYTMLQLLIKQKREEQK